MAGVKNWSEESEHEQIVGNKAVKVCTLRRQYMSEPPPRTNSIIRFRAARSPKWGTHGSSDSEISGKKMNGKDDGKCQVVSLKICPVLSMNCLPEPDPSTVTGSRKPAIAHADLLQLLVHLKTS